MAHMAAPVTLLAELIDLPSVTCWMATVPFSGVPRHGLPAHQTM